MFAADSEPLAWTSASVDVWRAARLTTWFITDSADADETRRPLIRARW